VAAQLNGEQPKKRGRPPKNPLKPLPPSQSVVPSTSRYHIESGGESNGHQCQSMAMAVKRVSRAANLTNLSQILEEDGEDELSTVAVAGGSPGSRRGRSSETARWEGGFKCFYSIMNWPG